MTYRSLLLPLRLGGIVGPGLRNLLCKLFDVAIGFSLGDLTGDRLAPASARPPLCLLLFLLLVLLIRWLRNLDDDLATIKILLVEEVDCPLSSL
jgi:hypothetical protein